MSVLHQRRPRGRRLRPRAGRAPAAPLAEREPPPPAEARPEPRTRISAAWGGIWTATVVFIALIVFMLQNTRSVEVSFLGMHGTLPLAMAMLIATVGGILLTLVVGTARITQLRRRLTRGPRS
jgi:uncharacterized integral membrane protein